MLFTISTQLEDKLVEQLLIDGPCTPKQLCAVLGAFRGSMTPRAVYKAITTLLQSGVLVKGGKGVQVDEEWRKRALQALTPPTGVPLLQQGENIHLSFRSFAHVDAYWKTVVANIQHSVGTYPVFFYNPHDFWVYVSARSASEQAYYVRFASTHQHGYFVIGGETPLDRVFKRQYQSEYLQIALRNIQAMRATDHITVLKEYVITVRIPHPVAQQIEQVYQEHEGEASVVPAIEHLYEQCKKIRVTIEHNVAKARRLRKVLVRDFAIPEAVRAQHDLY
jgi:hypothetical protein